MPHTIKYVARRYSLPNDKCLRICKDLLNDTSDISVRQLFAQIVKYSIKKNNFDTEFETLVEILQKTSDTYIQTQIVWALGYQIRNSLSNNSKKQIDENLVNQIKNILENIENQLDIDSLHFFYQQIQRQSFASLTDHQHDLSRKMKISADYSRKSTKKIVTKVQQVIKVQNQNYESVESKYQSNLAQILRNSQAKIEIKSDRERLPTISDEEGSDTSFFNRTYENVVLLYNRMKSGRILKQKDKDNYLPSKISNFHVPRYLLYDRSSRIECFTKKLFINRMIAEIFCEISKKQMLVDNAICSLMKCIDFVDEIIRNNFGSASVIEEVANNIVKTNQSRRSIVNRLLEIDFLKFYENAPKIIVDVALELFNENNLNAHMTFKIIISEFRKIGVAAISAIRNCAMRNSRILKNNQLGKIQSLLAEGVHDTEFKNCIINLLNEIDDPKNIDKGALFRTCLNQLEDTQTDRSDNSIECIFQQSKDANQFHLFSRRTILRIIRLLKRSYLSERTKILICATVNNYLERTDSKAFLSYYNLKIYLNFIKNSESSDNLKIEAFKSIIISAEKGQLLPNAFIKRIIKNLGKGTEKLDNIIIFVLGSLSERQPIRYIDRLTAKLSDDTVVVRDRTEISFEKKSDYTNDDPTISSIVARMFWKSLRKDININDRSLQNLVEALSSHDQQTCVFAAKALSVASNTHKISNEILADIKEHINSTIPDVSVYTTVAFSCGLARLSSTNEPIFESHIQILPKIYVFDDLQLDDESFAEIVNENILAVLMNEVKQNRGLDEEIFQIFDYLLLFENDYLKRIVEIVDEYTKNKHLIPKQTIVSLQNCVDTPELSEQILTIFQNVISNKQVVCEKILNIFADNLYVSDDISLRNQSLQVLTQADCNQDISDELFDLLVLEKASRSISTRAEDAYDALLYLCAKTKEGQKLTMNCFETLTEAFDKPFASNEILKILQNISTNGQIIPNALVENIVSSYDPNAEHQCFIDILENLVRNNQEISEVLLSKLELASENVHCVDRILLIFIFLGQKGERITKEILLKILDHFSKIDDLSIIQQYLHFICSIVERIEDYFQPNSDLISSLQKALVHAIQTKHIETIQKVVQSCQTFVLNHKIELNEECFEVLLGLLKNDVDHANIHEQIHIILNASQLDENQKTILNLSNLNQQSDEEFLDRLAKFDSLELLERNFLRIYSIIISRPNLVGKALQILNKCSNKRSISEELRQSLMVLHSSTSVDETRVLCHEILRQFDQTDSVRSVNQDTTEFMNECEEKLRKGISLPKQSIQKLFSIEIHPQIEQQLVEIYALILIQEPNYAMQDRVVDSLDKMILSQKITLNIINAYKEILKKTKCWSKNVIQIFIDILNKNSQDNEFHLDILICLALASEIKDISSLELFEINLSHENELVRYWSFRALRASYERGVKSSEFKEWCENIAKQFEEELKVSVNFDLNLFETISALKYIDYSQIKTIPQNQWIRKLVISDLCERFDITIGERLKLYQICLEIEDESNIPLKLLQHLYIHTKLSPNCCLHIIRILKTINFEGEGETTSNILLDSTDPLKHLQKSYLINMIQKRLINQTEISTEYIDNLASTMINKFDFDISERLLNALERLDNLAKFENLLNFAEENRIKISDIDVTDGTLIELERSLVINLLTNLIKDNEQSRLRSSIGSLFDNHWTFQQLKEILNACKSNENRKSERYFIEIVEMLSDYRLSSTEENQKRILLILSQPIENWIREVNKVIVECTFTSIGQVKNIADLIRELTANNSDNTHIRELSDSMLAASIKRIKSTKLVSDDILNNNRPIAQWKIDEIRKWSKAVKDGVYNDNEDFIVEACAVTKRAYYLARGFHLTDTQILSCLIALHTNNKHGRLLQVATGEGKSAIISILAVIHALRGNTIDIITSSPVLAQRDSMKEKKFYHLFELDCSHNNDMSTYLTGPKACYRKQIVYGEAAQFQFDILRTNYAQLNTLAGRKTQVAIVDEVDSMFIDDSSKIARLATTIPGMDQLQIIYHLLWDEFINLLNNIIDIDNKIYLFNEVVGYPQENGDDQIVNVLKERLNIFIAKAIEKNIKIPKHLRAFVDRQKSKWIDNVIIAYNYEENVHYIVQDGLIKPVDYDSTGAIQSSSSWSDGLHQFLQIKHNLQMTSETCTTNFLSNKGYFTKYKSNLFGLTGTLGSQKAKEVLAQVYNVDLVLIPNLRQKQYRSLPDIITVNNHDWLMKICDSAIREANKERGTLVICETIQHSHVIAEKLRKMYRSSAIKLYTMNNMNQEQNIEIIHKGEIIVATNLAGRGTDIKTDEIEEHGGLHVIVTFMPSNRRVEEQAFGRTARQGKRGTGQKILNKTDLTCFGNSDMSELSERRDKIESDMLDSFLDKELKLISLKDELFDSFCCLLRQIREDIRGQNSLLTRTTDQIKEVFKYCKPSIFESNLLMSIEEQWAMLLHEIDDLNEQQIREKYTRFHEKILKNYKNKRVIQSPFYYVNIGNDLIINDSSTNSKYQQAMHSFDQAIELDPDHSASAYVGRGWLLLKGRKNIVRSDHHDSNYKQLAIEQFQRALKILSEEMGQLIWIQTLVQKRTSNMNTALMKQILLKANILGSYYESIQTMRTVSIKSQRLIQIKEIVKNREESKQIILYEGLDKERARPCDIRLIRYTSLDNHKENLRKIKEIIIVKYGTQFLIFYMPQNGNCPINVFVHDQMLRDRLKSLNYDETILDRRNYSDIYESMYSKVRDEGGLIARDSFKFVENLQDNSTYDITFNDLTVRTDTGAIDQAIQTIHNVSKESSLQKSNVSICVSINQITSKEFKDFINPNIEIKDATKEEALIHLNDNSSFVHRKLSSELFSFDSCLIDFETIYDNKVPEAKSDLQANEVIALIKKQKEENLHYNLTFKSVNKTAKILAENILLFSRLSVEFLRQNAGNILTKLEEIQSNSVSLEITDTRENLIQIICSSNETLVELDLDTVEEQTYNRKIVNARTAKTLIEDMTKTSLTIKLLDVNKHLVKDIVDQCPDAIYSISFIAITDITTLLKGLKDEVISIRFDKLTDTCAQRLIEHIRVIKFDFSLTFENLTKIQLSKIIKIAPIKQEDINISKCKTIRDLFMNELTPHLEISELSARGIEYLLEINEKKFLPWRSIACIAAIGSIQMIAGGILITTGFGATVGMGLMTEGGADLFNALRIYSTREFSWEDYGKQKAVSLAISVASMGWTPIKDAGKGIRNLATGIREEITEQFSTRVIMNGRTIKETLTLTTKNLKSLPVKNGVVVISENVLRTGLNKVADLSSNFMLEQFKPQISQSIQCKVNTKFCEPKLEGVLRKMYAIDALNKNQQFKRKIEKILTDIINPNNSFFHNQWKSIGEPLIKGVLSSSDKIRHPVSMGFKILAIVNGIHEITNIVSRIHERLLKKLLQIDQEILSLKKILYQYCQVEKEYIDKICHILQQKNITNLNEELEKSDFVTRINNANFSECPHYKTQVTTVLTSLHTNWKETKFDESNQIMKMTSDMITEQIFQVVESQLILPLSTQAMGELTKIISEFVQDKFIVNPEQNSVSQNLEIKEHGKCERNTIEKQITYNARDNTIARSQYEMLFYSHQKDSSKGGKINQQTKDYIDGIKEDLPSSMLDVMTLGSEYNLDLKLVDDPNYQLTTEDKGKGTNVIIYNKDIRSFQLMSNDGTILDIPAENHNSGYAIIQKLLKDRSINVSISDLRGLRAQMVENNPRNSARALDELRWIETRHPKEANILLMRCSNTSNIKSKLFIANATKVIPNKVIQNALRSAITKWFFDKILRKADSDNKWKYILSVILSILVLVLLECCWYWFCFE